MALQPFSDYVFCEKVWMITDDGAFVGTHDYLFCIPSKITDHQYRKIITTKFSFKGKEIKDAIRDLIDKADSVKSLENELLEMKSEFEEMIVHDLNQVESFKVQSGFLGSGIHVQAAGKRGWSPFIQKLGKDKKAISEFYQAHSKRK